MAEGEDPRIVAGAVKAVQDGLARITLLGPVNKIRDAARDAGDSRDQITIIDPTISLNLEHYATIYLERFPQKYKSLAAAKSALTKPLNFAHMMVYQDACDGSVAGALHNTSAVIRSAQHIIGTVPEETVSSFFMMVMPQNIDIMNDILIFADCAWVVAPSIEQLAAIASATANSTKHLLGQDPKIAFLSFSTRGSAVHPTVKKIDKAAKLLEQLRPDLPIEKAIQFDAAVIPSVALRKAPSSKVAGHANILIFPNLEAGNIGYKIAERIGGAQAIGPIFQGLAKPANDLSRGCDVEAVYNMIAVTALQAQTQDMTR